MERQTAQSMRSPIGACGVFLALLLATSAPLRADDPQFEEVGRFLAECSRLDRFSGTVLIARHGKPLFEGAYGLADRRSGVSNTTATSTQSCLSPRASRPPR